MVTRTTPGTTVPVKIMRARKTQTLNVKVEELDLLAERQQTGEPERPQEPEEAKDTGFGMSIEPLTPNRGAPAESAGRARAARSSATSNGTGRLRRRACGRAT